MYMYDPHFGDMDVELEVPEDNPRLARIVYGYIMNTFNELTEDELEYLNEKYYDDIVKQAIYVQMSSSVGEEASIKLLH